MNKKAFTYKKSGVNIGAADKFVSFISKISSKKRGNKKFNNIGGFGSISNLPKNIKRPKIVACTDGVGTKIEIANLLISYQKYHQRKKATKSLIILVDLALFLTYQRTLKDLKL